MGSYTKGFNHKWLNINLSSGTIEGLTEQNALLDEGSEAKLPDIKTTLDLSSTAVLMQSEIVINSKTVTVQEFLIELANYMASSVESTFSYEKNIDFDFLEVE